MLIELKAGQAALTATLLSVKETMERGLHYMNEKNEALEEKHNDLDKKVAKQTGIGIGVSGLLSFLVAAGTAWWTRHS